MRQTQREPARGSAKGMTTMISSVDVLLLLLLPALASAVDGGALLDVYSNKLAFPRSTGGVKIQSMSVITTACVDAGPCLAQCSTDQLLTQDPAAIQDQVRQRT